MNILRFNINNAYLRRTQSNIKTQYQPKKTYVTALYQKKKHVKTTTKYNKITKIEDNERINKPSYLDQGLFMFTTFVFSSIMVLTTCIVLIITARQTSIEAESLHEQYDKLYEQVHMLEEKNIQDEIVLNAVVGRIVELNSIGII
jgi:hypothetical protein